MYYELHITIGNHLVSAKQLIEACNNWSYSAITGDLVLGKEGYEYATRHASGNCPFEDVVASLNTMATFLKVQGYPVIRQKVELVMYDKQE